MSGRYRTFVLQAVGVAVVIGIVFFAFLRPSDVGELDGIDAPGGAGPPVATPGDERMGSEDPRRRAKAERRAGDRADLADAGVFISIDSATDGGQAAPRGGLGPTDDQYTDAATALMERVREPSREIGR